MFGRTERKTKFKADKVGGIEPDEGDKKGVKLWEGEKEAGKVRVRKQGQSQKNATDNHKQKNSKSNGRINKYKNMIIIIQIIIHLSSFIVLFIKHAFTSLELFTLLFLHCTFLFSFIHFIDY